MVIGDHGISDTSLLQIDDYNTIQYNTIQYNTIQYNTIQYNTIQYNTIQYNTIALYCPVNAKFVYSVP